MSVIIRTPNNEIKLYCKGADSVIISRLRADDDNVRLTNEHLASFANDGLRTLCLAYRIIPSEEYEVTSRENRSIDEILNNSGMVGAIS